MRIACDVKGTLEGYKKKQVLRILDALSRAGHTIVIWSNLYSYAVDAVSDNNLNVEATSKSAKGDYGFEYDESKYFDLAIEDDRSQDYLAAKNFLWVDQIPEDDASVDLLIKELLEGQ